MAAKAAEAEVWVTGCLDARNLIDLAETRLVTGDKAKPGEYSWKAVEAAGGVRRAEAVHRAAGEEDG